MPQFDEYAKVSPFDISDNLGHLDQVGLLKSLTRRIIELEMKIEQQEKINIVLWERVKQLMEDAGVIDNLSANSAMNVIHDDFGVPLFVPVPNYNGGLQIA